MVIFDHYRCNEDMDVASFFKEVISLDSFVVTIN